MEKEKSLKILNGCLHELESMSQEEFDRKDKLSIVIEDKINRDNDKDDCFAIVWGCKGE